MIDKLVEINRCKSDIRAAINDKGVYVTQMTAFSEYANKIRQIEIGGGGSNGGLRVEDSLTVIYSEYFTISVAEAVNYASIAKIDVGETLAVDISES